MLALSHKKAVFLGISLLSAATLLQGCPLVLLGAAGGGTVMATQRRTLGMQTEDREIQIKTATRLSQALKGKDGAHINVAVFNRRVLLTGEVPDVATLQKALEAVRTVLNTQGIVNELKIQPASDLMSRSDDTYLTAKVKASLVKAENLSTNYFKVVTERGTVYLMGLVTPEEAKQAADITSRLSGVKQVVKVFEYLTPEQKKALTPVIDTTGSAATSKPAAAATPKPIVEANTNSTTPISKGEAVSAHPVSTAPISATPIDKAPAASNPAPH